MARRFSVAIYLLAAILYSIAAGSDAWAQNSQPPASCQDRPETLEYWRNVRKTADQSEAENLIVPLANCLRSANPELRDRIAYEVITYWLRNKKVSDFKVSLLRLKLLPWLKEGSGEQRGESAFARAFSALVLSEAVRYDSIELSMAGEEVFELHKAALEMFVSERDYRGLTQDYGWIHTIAHGADLLWRLALHPLSGAERQREILRALEQQISRSDLPPYTFNEADRLARVVAALIARNELTNEEIVDWVVSVSKPRQMENWNQAFSTPQGMAQLHNQKQFLRALREEVEEAGNEDVVASLIETLRKMP